MALYGQYLSLKGRRVFLEGNGLHQVSGYVHIRAGPKYSIGEPLIQGLELRVYNYAEFMQCVLRV